MSCLKELMRRCDAASPVLSMTWSPKLSPSQCSKISNNNNMIDELDNFQLPPSSLSISTRSKHNEGSTKMRRRKKKSPIFSCKDGNKIDSLSEMLYKCNVSVKNTLSPRFGLRNLSAVAATIPGEESQRSLHSANRILNSMIMCMESLRNVAKRQEKKCTVLHLNREIQSIRKHVRCDEFDEENNTGASVVCRSIRPTVMVFCKTRSFVRSELIRAKTNSPSHDGYSKWNTLLQNARDVLNREREMACPAEIRVARDGKKIRKSLIDSMALFLSQISLGQVGATQYDRYLRESKCALFSACDNLRATFRANGYEINDL